MSRKKDRKGKKGGTKKKLRGKKKGVNFIEKEKESAGIFLPLVWKNKIVIPRYGRECQTEGTLSLIGGAKKGLGEVSSKEKRKRPDDKENKL